MMLFPDPLPDGVLHKPAALSRSEQMRLAEALAAAIAAAPLYTPAMPRTGKEMSVRMTNCGALGWVTDRERGYRYQPAHPVTGAPWPPIPPQLLSLWREHADYPHPPEACLVNFYGADARMGMHQDHDEAALEAPVLSVSLGDACLFKIGGLSRSDPAQSLRLESGDVLVLGGPSRLRFHGVSRIYPGTSDLVPGGGRINLTLRRVTRPAQEAAA